MGTVEDQAALNAEAWRRSDPNREIPADAPPSTAPSGAGLQIGDMWSSGGMMPGVTTPDLQGGETFGAPLGGNASLPSSERPWNPLGTDKS